MKISFVAGISLAMIVVAINPAFAADKTTQKIQGSKIIKRPSGTDIVSPNGGVVALTVDQCTGLGGKAQVYLLCVPNLACVTVDPQGVVRQTCINGTK